MAELWVRMETLFKELWSSRYGVPSLENKEFVTWSKKLSKLTAKEFGVGFDTLEEEVAKAVQRKQKTYTPSYAEFIGYSRGPAQDAITAQQARQSEYKPLMITKQLTDDERDLCNQQSEALKRLFA
jgi:hypothetical protein